LIIDEIFQDNLAFSTAEFSTINAIPFESQIWIFSNSFLVETGEEPVPNLNLFKKNQSQK
jgi:hypothetical protein